MPIGGFEFRKASTQEWVDALQRNPLDEDAIRLLGTPQGDLTFEYASIPGSSWNAQRMGMFQAAVQNVFDRRVPRSSLRASDPDKTTDPANQWKFWDGTDIVYRDIEIAELRYSDTKGLTFALMGWRLIYDR